METGKVIDVEPLSKVCDTCKKNKGKNTTENELWKAEHAPKCKASYNGTAPAMEPEGAKRIFNCSVSSHNLMYDTLFGDGDSKSFRAIDNTYKEEYDVVVTKKECVKHVQKRLGTALQNLKKEKKGLAGKGKLTDRMIDKMQNYYGIAIRSNKSNLQTMKSNVLASLFPCASNDKRPYHSVYCPAGKDSWCGYQRDKAMNTKTYKHGKGLLREIIEEIKPVYNRLSEDNLLRKCLDGKTHNQNEAFNGMIWQRILKSVFLGSDSFKVRVYDAVAHFNIGGEATTKVLQALEMKPGALTHVGVSWADHRRVTKQTTRRKNPLRSNEDCLEVKIKELQTRTRRKNKEKEGETYAAGSY